MRALSGNTVRIEHVQVHDGLIESRPDVATVRRLQHVRGFPAVSVLASTTPADRLTNADAATLDRLVAGAVDRIRAEAPDAAPGLIHRLRSIALLAAAAPADAIPEDSGASCRASSGRGPSRGFSAIERTSWSWCRTRYPEGVTVSVPSSVTARSTALAPSLLAAAICSANRSDTTRSSSRTGPPSLT